jgi:phospholipase/carboxylesterase
VPSRPFPCLKNERVSDLGFIHRFVPAPSTSARTLLLLHGTGADENDLLDLGHALDPDAALLSPRGKILENGAPRFFRRLAEGVFDEEDVVRRAHELAEFIRSASIKYQIDLKRLIAVGYSNGANIAGAIMLLGVAPFSKAILIRAMVPLKSPNVPQLAGAGILLLAGQFDPIAQPPIVTRLEQILRKAGADVTLEFQPAGHEITGADVTAARDWLATHR